MQMSSRETQFSIFMKRRGNSVIAEQSSHGEMRSERQVMAVQQLRAVTLCSWRSGHRAARSRESLALEPFESRLMCVCVLSHGLTLPPWTVARSVSLCGLFQAVATDPLLRDLLSSGSNLSACLCPCTAGDPTGNPAELIKNPICCCLG